MQGSSTNRWCRIFGIRLMSSKVVPISGGIVVIESRQQLAVSNLNAFRTIDFLGVYVFCFKITGIVFSILTSSRPPLLLRSNRHQIALPIKSELGTQYLPAPLL
jgi:hypothetical protein